MQYSETIPTTGTIRYLDDSLRLVPQLHRLDGPAVEWLNGNKAWWAYGVYYGNTNMGMTQE